MKAIVFSAQKNNEDLSYVVRVYKYRVRVSMNMHVSGIFEHDNRVSITENYRLLGAERGVYALFVAYMGRI